jgi:hypothetical protein
VTRVPELAVPRRGPMGDAPGLISSLTVWTPIVPGREEELQQVIEGWPTGAESPAARIETTHLARWLIVPQLVYQGPPMKPDGLKSQYFAFTAAFDGPKEAYVEALRTRLPDECDETWGRCVGYPGTADAGAFARYLRHNELRNGLFMCTYPDATVAEIRAGLDLKRRLLAFVVDAQGLDAETLHRRFLDAFPLETGAGKAAGS